MLKFADDVPEWVKEWAEFLVEAVGVEHYKITVEMHDVPSGESNSGDGAAYLNERYHLATIRLRRGLVDDEDGRAVVLHELLHVRLAALDRLASITEDLLPESEQRVWNERYVDAEEQVIEGLARSLTPLLVRFVQEPEPVGA